MESPNAMENQHMHAEEDYTGLVDADGSMK
jgi:hypothetical protein